MTIRMSKIAALAALLAIGATQPLAAQRALRGPNVHKNSVKYSDAGAKPVTGRSGSASLEARALLAGDGSVQIDATTGNLEAGTTRGEIRKMQLKVLSPSGQATSTQNFNGNGSGRWSTTLSKLGTGSKLQLQATIGGVDGHRTDVVTLLVSVKRSPDVAVDGVAAPSRAIAGTPMNIVATVSERNGDVGARASCILSIDGQLNDQARGIWVAAGQTVSCAFQTQVASVGSHKVTVYVTGVSPLDYNQNDNSATTSVEVLSPEVAMGYSASFSSLDAVSYYHQKTSALDGSFLDEQTNQTTSQERTLTMTSATSSNSFTFPVSVRTALLADGVPAFDYTNSLDIQASESSPTSDCGVYVSGQFYLRVCNDRSATPFSQVALSSFDGRAVYFGSRFYQVEGEDAYIESVSSDTPVGAGGYAVTSSVQPMIELRDARGMLFSARPTINLQSEPISDIYNGCFLNPYTQVNFCTDSKRTGSQRQGTANGGM
ncbi:MAG TPA: hypothetical protein VFY85_02815 [Gemmatimonadaceae bacterium]|nr:hypothetical protein [Gemmatimonadaceae bacterium]